VHTGTLTSEPTRCIVIVTYSYSPERIPQLKTVQLGQHGGGCLQNIPAFELIQSLRRRVQAGLCKTALSGAAFFRSLLAALSPVAGRPIHGGRAAQASMPMGPGRALLRPLAAAGAAMWSLPGPFP
jgi:hypothetical protein